MTFDITPIVNALIGLCAAVITCVVVPWIKSKTDAQRQEDILQWVKIAVQAAEQIYNQSGMGEYKKKYVLDFLEKNGFVLDTNEIDAMIESAVLELKK